MSKAPQQNLDRARKLRDVGVPLWIALDDREDSVSHSSAVIVHQIGGVADSRVFDTKPECVGLIIDLCIVPNATKPLAIDRFELKVPWGDVLVEWLLDPGYGELYKFPGEPGLEYQREVVLNHRTGTEQIFRKGYPLQGLLLGRAPGLIPQSQHWPDNLVPMKFAIIDQFGHEHSKEIRLWAARRERTSEAAKRARRRLITRIDDEITSAA